MSRFTVEGDTSAVLEAARLNGWKIVRLPWWERTYAIPRWIVWLAAPQIAIQAVRGVYLLVEWVS